MSVVVGASSLVAAAPAQAATAKPGYVAQSYGTYVFNDNRSIVSGPTAYSDIACGAAPGSTAFNNSALVVLPGGLGRVAAQLTRVQALESGNTRTSVALSQTNGINLLGGVITSGLIQTSTRTTFNGSTFSAAQSTSIANLKVLGVSVGANPAPNTKINLNLPVLGNVGYVELNRQVNRPVNGGREAITTALHVVLLSNNPWLPGVGYNLWVANAKAELTAPAVGFLKGQGFATRIVAANGTVSSGPTCARQGSVHRRQHHQHDRVDPPAGERPRQWRRDDERRRHHHAHERQQQGHEHDRQRRRPQWPGHRRRGQGRRHGDPGGAGPIVRSDAGSKFVNLQVGGTPVAPAKLKPNSTIKALDGAVTVTLHKVKTDSRTIEVTMIELVVTDLGTGLPIGTKVEIGRAYAGITPAAG